MPRLRTEVERRFSDLDVMGHVNNVTYLVYLEEARVRLLTQLGGAVDELPGLVVARQEIDYVRPLFLSSEPVVVECWVDRIGTTSFVLAYDVLDGDGGAVCARALSVVVGFDQATQSKAPLAADIVALLGRYEDDQA